jgi:hypothetical protein
VAEPARRRDSRVSKELARHLLTSVLLLCQRYAVFNDRAQIGLAEAYTGSRLAITFDIGWFV